RSAGDGHSTAVGLKLGLSDYLVAEAAVQHQEWAGPGSSHLADTIGGVHPARVSRGSKLAHQNVRILSHKKPRSPQRPHSQYSLLVELQHPFISSHLVYCSLDRNPHWNTIKRI